MIMHIVGNRPQFIKLAPISKEIRKRGYSERIIHTGQHYDENMSDIFFEELGIPKPDKNLGIGSGTHGEMTGKAIIELEKVLMEYKPKCVILYGDTDSTIAGAIATVKLNIPIVHVEAGVRTSGLYNPEEANRVVVDHLSEVLFCSDSESLCNLQKEGLREKAIQVGDVMYDTFLQFRNAAASNLLDEYGVTSKNYVLMTWHRQENTSSRERMLQIIEFLSDMDCEIICPLHPRTLAKLQEFNLMEEIKKVSKLHLIKPVGYIEMVKLMTNARIILTDSGGVSKESFFAGVGCILMVDLNLWPDLMKSGWITKLDFDSEESRNHAKKTIDMPCDKIMADKADYYGTGDTAVKIVDILERKGLL